MHNADGLSAEPLVAFVSHAAFFFVSGMLLEKRFSYSVKTFVGKNLRSLFVPQITLAVLGAFSNILIDVVLLKKCPLKNVDFFGGFFSWFLPTLFLMNMAIYFCAKLHLLGTKIRYVVGAVAIVVFLLLPATSGLLLQTVCGICFGLIGLFVFPLVQRWARCQRWHGIGIFGLVICAVLSFYNAPIRMFLNDYGARPLFLLTALIGVFSMVDLGYLLQNAPILQYFGKYSIIVYVTHLAMMPLLHRIYRYLISGSLENHGKYPHFLILFLVVVLIELVLLPFVIKICPCFFGIKRLSK